MEGGCGGCWGNGIARQGWAAGTSTIQLNHPSSPSWAQLNYNMLDVAFGLFWGAKYLHHSHPYHQYDCTRGVERLRSDDDGAHSAVRSQRVIAPQGSKGYKPNFSCAARFEDIWVSSYHEETCILA
jgi:hypothetical protein